MCLLPLATEVITEVLGREDPNSEDHFHAAKVSGGSLGRARQLLSEDARKIHDLVVGMCADPDNWGPGLSRTVLASAEGREQARQHVRLLLYLLGARQREASSAYLASGLDRPYPARSLDPWLARSELLFQAEEDLELQIPPEQLLTGLFLRWREIG